VVTEATEGAIQAFRRAFLLAGGPIGAGDEAIRAGLAAADVAPTEDPMPVFVIKGKDALAPDTVQAYFTLCLAQGLTRQAAEVADAAREIREWQARNPDLVKTPDHPHVPVSAWP
jgi:hypothetical protein